MIRSVTKYLQRRFLCAETELHQLMGAYPDFCELCADYSACVEMLEHLESGKVLDLWRIGEYRRIRAALELELECYLARRPERGSH